MSALFLARWFIPAEAADRGLTLWLSALTLLAIGCFQWFAWRTGRIVAVPRTGAMDWAVAALAGGHLLSAGMVLIGSGDGRAAINIAWEWVAFWGLFRSLRGFMGGSESIPPPATCLILAGSAIAAYGAWQHHVWYPRMAQEVRAQISGESAGNELWQQQLGDQLRTLDSTGRQLLLARLTESTEPIGRFALANTLAGILAAVAVLALSMVVSTWKTNRVSGLWWSACTLLIVYCLALTKSRTAYVGLGAGLLLWAGGRIWKADAKQRRRVIHGVVAGGGLMVLAITLLVANGSLDRKVLWEAPKSLEYRLQYWSSTWQMLKDHPVFGVGPGNFRQHYLQYKLPESSEEILDPHNLLLDVWANGGLLALAGLLAVCVLVGRSIVLGMRAARDVSPQNSHAPAGADVNARISASAVAIVTAICVLGGEWLIQGAADPLLFWLLAGWIGASIVHDRLVGRSASQSADISLAAFAASWLALTVHLLGAGGIAMVAVGQLWLWLALWIVAQGKRPMHAADQGAPDNSQRMARQGPVPLWSPVVWIAAALACTVTAVVPNSLSESAVEMGRSAYAGTTPVSAAKSALREAIEADPLAPEPRQMLAQLLMAEWSRNPRQNTRAFADAVHWQKEAIARDPAGANRYRVMGSLYWERYQLASRAAAAAAAADWYARAASRYPNLPAIQAEYAIASDAAGRAAAPAIARRALMLDQLSRQLGHTDKWISEDLVRRLQGIAGVSRQ